MSPLFRRRPVERGRSGDFEVRLDDGSREVLRSVAGQLRALLDAEPGDPSLRRLFPVAYADDPAREEEYRRLVGDELAERRRAALDTFATTADATSLTEEEVVAWMGAVNDLRLVLGTRLDVSEDMDPLPDPTDPDAPLLALYGFLGYLLESIVEALAEDLDDPG